MSDYYPGSLAEKRAEFEAALAAVIIAQEVYEMTYEVSEDGTVFDFLFDDMPECENPF